MYVTRSMSMEWTSNFSARQPTYLSAPRPHHQAHAALRPNANESVRGEGSSGRRRSTCLLFWYRAVGRGGQLDEDNLSARDPTPPRHSYPQIALRAPLRWMALRCAVVCC